LIQFIQYEMERVFFPDLGHCNLFNMKKLH